MNLYKHKDKILRMINNNLDSEKNKTLNLKESLKGLKVIKSSPVRISLNLTGKCNIRCIYCHLTYADYFSKDEFSIEDFKKIDWALTKTSHLVYFSSTEPLSAANFREIFINSKKYKTEKYLSTNGIQITDEIAKSFVKEELNFLTVSFGGLTEKTFIKAHKVNKLQDVLKKVDLINIYKKKYNSSYPKLRMVLVVMKSNAHELPLAVKMAKKYKFSEGLKITYLKAYHENLIKELPFNNKKYVQKYVREAQELGKKIGVKVDFDGGNFDEIEIDKNAIHHRKCLEPWQRLHIEANGDVHVCPSPRNQEVAGNIKKEKVSKIWNGEVYQKFRRRVNSNNPPEVCKRCTHNFHKVFSRADIWDQTDLNLGIYKRKKESAVEKLLKKYQK